MRFLNHIIKALRFKYKGLVELVEILRPGDFQATINFKDRFFHIKVDLLHQLLLGFEWNSWRYCYQVLPFSMAVSPWAFIRFIWVVIAQLHQNGIQALAYMDNLIILRSLVAEVKNNVKQVLSLLHDLGWMINTDKSSLEPKQIKEFLGLLVDTTGSPASEFLTKRCTQ